ncbi:MAG: serine hydrolase [Candidatus Aminicenantes bacterium]|nr:serine hydrolase [Candidatus Aminicenantes bacterium]NIM82742.1 serine hydrolase [Candidatus Aminicenantes bacterium]NIN22119.1 serine hydrolase [Candidatus Aminicenantes bacterium]NIN45878.1 serine hydrolase [Candidatus Aminicenantes bacterium]NIN88715.1 serine hydrolase [Candidatus Aminicenantes bacterium]
MRKSLLSAVYGTHVDDGSINLDKTLEELKIDDQFPLTKEEKQARIRDLLKARSGVYHPAAYETQQMKARRPKRGSYKRNTFWYYNNWDFNTLCTILEQETKTDFFLDFKKRIADPIQMEDFRLIDGYHHLEPENSTHPAYPFRLSARDLARFAQLFLQQGKWNNKQVISRAWIKESTTAYSCAGVNFGYGYLWWVYHDFKNVGGMYAALGVGTQVAAVLPGANMVIVQRVDTYKGKRARPNKKLIRMILDAKLANPKPNPELIPLQNTPSYKRPKLTTLKPKILKKYIKEYQVGDYELAVKKLHGYLVVEMPSGQPFHLLPVSKTQFVAEDIEAYGFFELDRKGIPVGLTILPSPETAALYADIKKMGPEAAIQAYKAKRKRDKDAYTFGEGELNSMGYQLLGMKEIKAAIEVFKLNVELYPKSFNVYDSLGEAYMVNGDIELAITNYKKSLELNPRNTNAVEKLKELKAPRRGEPQ